MLPWTEAGKRLWELLDRVQPGANGDVLRMGMIRSAIAAIEAEAVASERAEIARLRGFLSDIAKMPEKRGYDPSPQGIARLALLASAPSEPTIVKGETP